MDYERIHLQRKDGAVRGYCPCFVKNFWMLASAKFFVKIRERRIYFIMKLFRLMGTMTIVAAVAATMAVSASALTANYADNKVTLDDVAAANAGDYTVVITTAAVGNDTSKGDIFQLAQSEAAPTEVAVDADLAYGKYYVRVGGYEAGYQTAEFVKAPAAAVATGAISNANEADAAVAYYSALTEAPTSLTPYWTNGTKKIAATIDWANVDGNVMLGLTVDGATELANMSIIWE
jgi:hypothetical protein